MDMVVHVGPGEDGRAAVAVAAGAGRVARRARDAALLRDGAVRLAGRHRLVVAARRVQLHVRRLRAARGAAACETASHN